MVGLVDEFFDGDPSNTCSTSFSFYFLELSSNIFSFLFLM